MGSVRSCAILGLTRGTTRDDIVTATLQGIAFQTRDLIDAMADDGISPSVIRVDGGMVQNDWFLQFLADILEVPVQRPVNAESTVLGAAYLAGLGAGVFESPEEISALWKSDALFEPGMSNDQREKILGGWATAVGQVQSNNE